MVAKRLRVWWASPPRAGARRLIAPWEYRHLRFWARVRLASGAVLAVLATLTLAFGGAAGAAYAWATVFGLMAAAQLVVAWWELAIARSR
jgi:hypothetical protein